MQKAVHRTEFALSFITAIALLRIEIRRTITRDAAERGVTSMAQEEFGNIPRKDIQWFPTIDEEKCTGCGVCVEFCHQGVFSADGEGTEVVRPYSCIVGCTGCAGQCPVGAISVPTLPELREMLKVLRAKYGSDRA